MTRRPCPASSPQRAQGHRPPSPPPPTPLNGGNGAHAVPVTPSSPPSLPPPPGESSDSVTTVPRVRACLPACLPSHRALPAIVFPGRVLAPSRPDEGDIAETDGLAGGAPFHILRLNECGKAGRRGFPVGRGGDVIAKEPDVWERGRGAGREREGGSAGGLGWPRRGRSACFTAYMNIRYLLVMGG